MVSAALLFTSIQNYSYSFDRNPMESGVDKEESDGENEDSDDGGNGGNESLFEGIHFGYFYDEVEFVESRTVTTQKSFSITNLGVVTSESVTYVMVVCCMLNHDKTSPCNFSTESSRCKALRTREPQVQPIRVILA